MLLQQRTISREVSLTGPGLFSGESATLTFMPADADAGITFVREQDGKVANIAARVENVLKRPRSHLAFVTAHCLLKPSNTAWPLSAALK